MVTSPYLREILNNYFQDRKVIYLMDEGIRSDGECPTGLCTWATTWNIMYGRVLRLQLPNGTTIVGFADGIAKVAVAKTGKEIQEETNTAVQKVRAWLDEVGLTLTAHKTDAIFTSGRKLVEKMQVTVKGTRIESKRTIKYLGVIINDKLNFKGT